MLAQCQGKIALQRKRAGTTAWKALDHTSYKVSIYMNAGMLKLPCVTGRSPGREGCWRLVDETARQQHSLGHPRTRPTDVEIAAVGGRSEAHDNCYHGGCDVFD